MEQDPVLVVGAMLRIHHMVVHVFTSSVGGLMGECSVGSLSLWGRVACVITSVPLIPGRGRTKPGGRG